MIDGREAVLFLVGDGRGVPVLDENSYPIHVRFVLERIPNEKGTPRELIDAFFRKVGNDSRS